MVYTQMTMKALKFAYNAHSEQVDLNDIPYIFHPYHLAEQMDDEISCTVALLHDVVENTKITLEDLKPEFPHEVVEAVAILTHDESVNYFEYIKGIKVNPVALKVKLAGLAHNSDDSRWIGTTHIEELDFSRRKERYLKAKEILLNTLH